MFFFLCLCSAAQESFGEINVEVRAARCPVANAITIIVITALLYVFPSRMYHLAHLVLGMIRIKKKEKAL